jgi:hypothetical protein
VIVAMVTCRITFTAIVVDFTRIHDSSVVLSYLLQGLSRAGFCHWQRSRSQRRTPATI